MLSAILHSVRLQARQPRRDLKRVVASMFAQISKDHRQFFAFHLRKALAGDEAECTVRLVGGRWGRWRRCTMQPIVEDGRVTAVELQYEQIVLTDVERRPCRSSHPFMAPVAHP